ncbi:hypothetical protein AB4305_11600 [Nocardia sp. 2YAB30]|uniref:hypothetical protein n=1 Tax=unclassified Nocardia TaxID=2637762 RepID=UPI003F9437A1
MIVDDVVRQETAQGWRLSAAVRARPRLAASRLYFEVHGGMPDWMPERGDAFLAALLMPAMSLGEELVIDAPVSPRLLRSVHTVMDIYAAWWGELHGIRLATAEVAASTHSGNSVGLFFTTGVDCFYSLLKDRERGTQPGYEPITELLFVNFEQQSGPDYDRLLGRVQQISAMTGCRTVVVDTNIRAMTDLSVEWEAYHGAALGSVALALSGLLGRCVIAASDHYCHLPALGSHPVLDHLWSSERLEVVHDGAEATRTQKVERQLAHSPLALANLGVCWRSRPAHNCGVCEKCLRTMIALELAGCLDRCQTLPNHLDLDLLRGVSMGSADAADAMRSIARDARIRRRLDIADAAEEALRRQSSAQSGRSR